MRTTWLVCTTLAACGGSRSTDPRMPTMQPPLVPLAAGPTSESPVSAEPPPAPVTVAPVTVAFSIKPQVGEGTPVLSVTVTNPQPAPVPLTRFDAPACFARHYLAIKLSPAKGKPPTQASCAVKDWPGIDDQIAPGASLTIDLPMAELFSPWPPGRYAIEIDWDPSELERVRPGTSVPALQTSLDATEFAIAKVLATFRIERGKTFDLPDGRRLTFRAHGHKHTMPDGPPSPLIIHGDIAAKKQRAAEFFVNVFVEERRLFQIDDLVFELVDHAYDDWMQLRYFGPIKLQ